MFVVTFYMYIYNKYVFEYLNKYYALSHIIPDVCVCGGKRLLYITQCYSNPVYSGHALTVLRQPTPLPY